MKNIEIYTIGVYGSDARSFFNKLTDNRIDTFCDIRRRRGVRGSDYSFANSKRLQKKLSQLGINYIHIPDLSPTDEIRKIQYASDKEENTSQRKRESLSDKFISVYKKEILLKFDFQTFIDLLNSVNAEKVVLFCVENLASACHRSIVAEKLNSMYKFPVKNI